LAKTCFSAYVKYFHYRHILRRMKTTHVVALTVVLTLVTVSALPGVAAQPEITLAVDGEEVSDGDTVEVGSTAQVRLTVNSDVKLTSARIESGSMFNIAGLDRTTYNVTQPVTVSGQQELSVEVTDVEGGTSTRTVVLTRSSDTGSDLQREVDSLRDGIESVQDDVDDLRERRDELQQRNENLTRRLNETRSDIDGESDGTEDSGGGGGQGMPGFTAVAALVALSVAVIGRRRG